MPVLPLSPKGMVLTTRRMPSYSGLVDVYTPQNAPIGATMVGHIMVMKHTREQLSSDIDAVLATAQALAAQAGGNALVVNVGFSQGPLSPLSSAMLRGDVVKIRHGQ